MTRLVVPAIAPPRGDDNQQLVIPAKAGIQEGWHGLDSGFRRNDETLSPE
jgi:hypothetical protein